MIKQLEVSTPTSCLNKAGANEPIFVLRAKDPLAAAAIRYWVMLRREANLVSRRFPAARVTAETIDAYDKEHAKLDEALRLADAMDAWRLIQSSTVPGDANR